MVPSAASQPMVYFVLVPPMYELLSVLPSVTIELPGRERHSRRNVR